MSFSTEGPLSSATPIPAYQARIKRVSLLISLGPPTFAAIDGLNFTAIREE